MRRITIFADEEDAKKATAWLEANGLDYMSEDYADPSIARRSPPTRRPAPERHEPPGGFLTPLRTRPRTLKASLLEWLKDGDQTLDELAEVAHDRGWSRKKVRDTLRRMLNRDVVVDGEGRYIRLEAGDG